MTLIEKILANHSKEKVVCPGDIVDIEIDVRAARDFGGANVVKNMQDHQLKIHDPSKTFFTFDCNPTGSDQKYAVNQQICRLFARDNGVKVFDINTGIGTHTLIEKGLAYSGSTAVTTDSHANILGAVGAFGQGMGDKDIAAAIHKGKVWFKVPKSVKINLRGKRPKGLYAKDIVLGLLDHFGANSLLGYSVELYGEEVDKLTLDERITIASMGTEMGCIILLFTPNEAIMEYSEFRRGEKLELIKADKDAEYEQEFHLDLDRFVPRLALPGEPHNTVPVKESTGVHIDSAFIGSCTNGRMEDFRIAAKILKGKKIAPGVVFKIVPATDEIWNECLKEGLINIFKEAGAMVSNAGCAGCAAGQVGQNGEGEVSISTGNRNFPGKQGKGKVYLASPATVAASAIAGCIVSPDKIPDKPLVRDHTSNRIVTDTLDQIPGEKDSKPKVVEGRVWYIPMDNIDTDMIFHNRYLTITDLDEMGKYTFDNLKGFENFSRVVMAGDIVVVHKNFGSGSSRQQAVDCFKALGVQAIVAESYGAIYERNAINAAFPIVTCKAISNLHLSNGDDVRINFETGEIQNLTKEISVLGERFSEVQLEIYQNGGLF
ncbi:homoaconitate hydratase family protein [Marinifilum sp. JC070]|uniref:Homoaconitate hydratase family protein n=2 Tax=Marinifilum caeruleilacunae TaxID=2499076 RepID=A0ABX1WXH2_9BACT|nr:homoaconitate hydratase family protein [Marinifilum caeruleilacunae]